jgi:hypothetical protein
MAETAIRYLEHLSAADRALLTAATGSEVDEPARAEAALGDARVFDAVFGPPPGTEGELASPATASPFLVFAVAVHRVAADLRRESYVEERISARQRVPVFDLGPLRDLGDDPRSRLFMAELLGSFTRVSGGAIWVRDGVRGARRVRVSDLDPARLAGVLDLVPEAERAGVYRRLGDLALFLSGVFPDHTARPVHPIELTRMLRSLPPKERDRPLVDGLEQATDDAGMGGLLGVLGPRWYRLAAERVPVRSLAPPLHAAADRFVPVRRYLSVVTDRYLFPLRAGWFPAPGSN